MCNAKGSAYEGVTAEAPGSNLCAPAIALGFRLRALPPHRAARRHPSRRRSGRGMPGCGRTTIGHIDFDVPVDRRDEKPGLEHGAPRFDRRCLRTRDDSRQQRPCDRRCNPDGGP